MVQVCIGIPTAFALEDAILVELELDSRCIDGDTHWTCGKSCLDLITIARSHIVVIRYPHVSGVHVARFTAWLDTRVRVICLINSIIRHQVGEAGVDISAIASISSDTSCCTIEDLLLAKIEQFTSGNLVCTFQSSISHESPARATLTLILNRRHSTFITPINTLRETASAEILDWASLWRLSKHVKLLGTV